MAKRSLVKVPYRNFFGKELIVKGFKSRGIYKVKILQRANVPGETETDQRFMICKVIECYRNPHNIEPGTSALLPIIHSIKEPIKKLVENGNWI